MGFVEVEVLLLFGLGLVPPAGFPVLLDGRWRVPDVGVFGGSAVCLAELLLRVLLLLLLVLLLLLGRLLLLLFVNVVDLGILVEVLVVVVLAVFVRILVGLVVAEWSRAKTV